MQTWISNQATSFQKKLDEKLRGFLNCSSGKACVVWDLVSDENRALLSGNRMAIWSWFQRGAEGSSPLLPVSFPTQFFVLKLGPIVVGVDAPSPTPSELVPMESLNGIVALNTRRTGYGEFNLTISLDSFETFTSTGCKLKLKKSERYVHSLYGTLPTEQYGQVGVSMTVTTLSGILNSANSGLNGCIITGNNSEAPPYRPLTPIEQVNERIAWFEGELALVETSITSPAVHAAGQSNLRLRSDVIFMNVNPSQATWRGEPEYLVAPALRSIGGINAVSRMSLGVTALSHSSCFSYIQIWFNGKVSKYTPDGEDPGPENGLGRLHFLLAESMRRQELMAAARENKDLSDIKKSVYPRSGGLEKDIGTPLERLSVYDPKSNPDGIFLFPTYIPTHLVRLTEWFEAHLPELKETLPNGSFKVHFLHIDSEGEFFQLHTETGGSIILFTGMAARVQRELLEQVKFRFRIDLSDQWRELEELFRAVCREFTLSRLDVVFGGDRAACPLASHSKKLQHASEVPWMDADMTGWYWFIRGQPGRDFFCTRSIDPDEEQRIVASCPLGFKSLIDCGVAKLVNTDTCICAKIFGAEYLKKCDLSHPQLWHGYPQSGAVSSKNLSKEKLDWTILYYAVADLIKAKMLTQHQPCVNIHIVTPFIVS